MIKNSVDITSYHNNLSTSVDIKKNVPLSPMQQWFFDEEMINNNYFVQSMILTPIRPLDFDLLKNALFYLIKHHEMLRVRFMKLSDSWCQELMDNDTFPYEQIYSIVKFKVDTAHNQICNYIDQVNNSFKIEEVPLFKVLSFEENEQFKQSVAISIQHLLVDRISWQILIKDLEDIYLQIESNNKVILPPKTNTYLEWSHLLNEKLISQQLNIDVLFWKKVVASKTAIIYPDTDSLPATVSTADSCVLIFTEEETQNLLTYAHINNITLEDMVLMTLVQVIGEWTGSYELVLSLTKHDRNHIKYDLDLTGTVGWFTTIYPIHLTLKNPTHIQNSLIEVNKYLSKIPSGGISYELLKHQILKEILNSKKFRPQIVLNDLGTFDSKSNQNTLFTYNKESQSMASDNNLPYLLDIDYEIHNGNLEIAWNYSKNRFKTETIKKYSNLHFHFMKRLLNQLTIPQEN